MKLKDSQYWPIFGAVVFIAAVLAIAVAGAIHAKEEVPAPLWDLLKTLVGAIAGMLIIPHTGDKGEGDGTGDAG